MSHTGKRIIRGELSRTLVSVDLALRNVRVMASEQKVEPEAVRDHRGDFPIIPLLAAKATILGAFAQLEIHDEQQAAARKKK